MAIYSLTDLHTHILPAFDDGANSMDTALHMLRMQRENGVDRVVLTPHFYPTREKLESFIARRQSAFKDLLACYDSSTMPQLYLGAEVRYTPDLLQMDLHQLTLGSNGHLLLELPGESVATYVDQVVEEMIGRGIKPILAHVERCSVFRNEPHRLYNLVRMGALAQIDLEALVDGKPDKFAAICLKSGLAQIIASDMHNLKDRSVCLGNAVVGQYAEIVSKSEQFARAIWDGTPLPAFEIKTVKKCIFGYRACSKYK